MSVPPNPDLVLVATHLVAGVGTGLLFVLSLAAFTRRGSRSYVLVVLALAAVPTRTGISLAAMFGPLSAALHHLVEHALDAMAATFLLATISDARTDPPSTPDEPTCAERSDN